MTTPKSLGDQLEVITADQLVRAGSLHNLAQTAGGAPSNAQILNAMKTFYNAHTAVVDGSADNTKTVAQNQPEFVKTMNGYNWQQQQLAADEQATTQAGIFGDTSKAAVGGIFDPALDDIQADHLFSTIGLGVSADVQLFVGGAGGLGCMWDIAQREPCRGYGYATGEIGLRFTAELNVQVFVTNQLPSQTDFNVFGLKVSISLGISLSFATFWYGNDLTLLGFAVGAGVGLGGGATVFGGHIWNFG
ncbi:hypothetical protein [Leekyejoonella antrihumi]|uniref:Uncharacterized protein n=1 Tax=Leekyejoonella antrihumi TaxID=1660198 RepID=A0A563E1P9_9MICO|nr:hypothetical protein [Leekyejoonella antrihumi]TWP36163.1 hypothetical protein FGL98_10700 [Leekyejoonella antrihumi]